MKVPSLCFVFILSCLITRSQDKILFDSLAKPKLIAQQFSFTEGPSVDKKGNVFFTDQPNNKIWKYDTEGRLTLFMDNAGRSNGTYFDKKGNLVTCADEHDQLWSIDKKGHVTVLVKNFQGHRLNGPNDVWLDNKGGMYFTDPYYQRDYWDRTITDMDGEKVYYLPKKGSPIIVEAQLVKPNGIVGTPDGKYLYVADIKAGKTYRFNINADGTLSARQLLINQGSDGMTLDAMGNIYLTGNGINIFSPNGNKIGHINVPERPSNICFAGKDRKLLFITARTGIYTMPMNVKGVE